MPAAVSAASSGGRSPGADLPPGRPAARCHVSQVSSGEPGEAGFLGYLLFPACYPVSRDGPRLSPALSCLHQAFLFLPAAAPGCASPGIMPAPCLPHSLWWWRLSAAASGCASPGTYTCPLPAQFSVAVFPAEGSWWLAFRLVPCIPSSLQHSGESCFYGMHGPFPTGILLTRPGFRHTRGRPGKVIYICYIPATSSFPIMPAGPDAE